MQPSTDKDTKFNLTVRRVYPEVRNGTFKIDMIFRDSMPDNIRTGQTYYISLQLGSQKSQFLYR